MGEDEAASAEQDFRASLEALEAYKAQLDALYQQHELLRLSLEDHSRAAESKLYAEMGVYQPGRSKQQSWQRRPE